MKVVILLPAFNEAERIGAVVCRIREVLPEGEIVVAAGVWNLTSPCPELRIRSF
jgi:hypothetical protein